MEKHEESFRPLSALCPGEEAVIAAVIDGGGPESPFGRLAQLGYFPGERVKKVLESPLGDPSAYLVRGTVTAIRRQDARFVIVGPFDPETEAGL